MTSKLFSYNKFSQGGKALADGLGIKRIKHQGSRYRWRRGDTLINWGASNFPEDVNVTNDVTILNTPTAVRIASNKLEFFRLMGEIDAGFTPPYTEDRDEAIQWAREGRIVVCRTVLNGHSGAGIVVAETEEAIVPAPLYVQYIKKAEEFRVHVMHGEVFDIQRKARRVEVANPNWRVRNHANGFIYVRNDINVPEHVTSVSEHIMDVLPLDFGAVDVIWNAKEERAYGLEINTAPGLTGTTLDNYVAKFKEVL